MAKVIAIVNQKGGVGKTTTCENLAAGLAMNGKRVLAVDFDHQASLTISLGHPFPDELDCNIAKIMEKVILDQDIGEGIGILHYKEGFDLMPSSIELSGIENTLVNVMSRETILKQYIETVEDKYDYILLDCSPNLGMLTINAMAAADSLIIPVQAQYLSVKGLEQLMRTINKIRKQINKRLRIEGVLLTMVDTRTNNAKDMIELIQSAYGTKINVYSTFIPRSVRAEEISAEGKSIFLHDPNGRVAEAYKALTEEVLANERK